MFSLATFRVVPVICCKHFRCVSCLKLKLCIILQIFIYLFDSLLNRCLINPLPPINSALHWSANFRGDRSLYERVSRPLPFWGSLRRRQGDFKEDSVLREWIKKLYSISITADNIKHNLLCAYLRRLLIFTVGRRRLPGPLHLQSI